MFLKFVELSFFAWYVIHAQYQRQFVGILFAIGICAESVLALLQFLNQGSLGGLLYYIGERSFSASTPGIANASVQGELILRPYATFSHPNMLAGYLVVAMLLVGYLLSLKRFFSKIFIPLSFIAGTIGLAISLSRLGVATWMFCGILFVGATIRERIGKTVLLLALVVLTVWIFVIALSPAIFFRLVSFSFGQSLSERVMLAKSAVAMIASHPIIGVGPGNFLISLPYFSGNIIVLQPVHNIYLLIASELGIPGFLIFLSFCFLLVTNVVFLLKHSLVGKKNELLFLSLAFLAILFSGFFDHYFLTLQQGQLLFSLVIGLILREKGQYSATI